MPKFKNNINRPSNYVPPSGASSFGKTWEPGEYVAVGIKWVAKDDAGHPILKQQKNGVMSARLRLVVKEQEKESGPYYLADLVSMNLLVKAFNKEVELLPIPDEKDAEEVRKFLNYCGEAINSSGNEVKFKMGEKFIQWIDGMYIEADTNFIMRVVKIISKNEFSVPSWRWQEFSEDRRTQLIDVILEIVAREGGAETPWKGAQFKTQVPYGFRYYEQDDVIGFKANDNGDDTSSAYALRKFMANFCPRLLTEGAEESYPTDVNNIVPWMIQYRDDILFQALVKNSPGKNGGMFYNVDWGKSFVVTGTPLGDALNVKPLEIEELDIPEEMKPQPKQEIPVDLGGGPFSEVDNLDIDAKAQQYLHEALNILADGEVFGENSLTDKGKVVIEKYFKPLAEAGKIPPPPLKLTKVNYEEAKDILSALVEFETNGELKVKLAHKLDKLVESLLGFDEEKEPEQAFEFSDDDGWV